MLPMITLFSSPNRYQLISNLRMRVLQYLAKLGYKDHEYEIKGEKKDQQTCTKENLDLNRMHDKRQRMLKAKKSVTLVLP